MESETIKKTQKKKEAARQTRSVVLERQRLQHLTRGPVVYGPQPPLLLFFSSFFFLGLNSSLYFSLAQRAALLDRRQPPPAEERFQLRAWTLRGIFRDIRKRSSFMQVTSSASRQRQVQKREREREGELVIIITKTKNKHRLCS